MTKQHIQGQALLAPQSQALPSLSTPSKSSAAMTRSWSMLEMTEMKVIHDLQDDMEGMLSIDEEVHPSAMGGRLLSDTSEDDEDDDFLFYDDEKGEESVSEERHQAPSLSLSASQAVNEDADDDDDDDDDDKESTSALAIIEEESHENDHDHEVGYEKRIDKALQGLGKRNVFRTLGMKRARSTLDFRSPSRDLDVSVRRVNVHRYDSDDDEDGGLVNDKHGHGNGIGNGQLDVTLRTVNITNKNGRNRPISISPDCVAAGAYDEDSPTLNKGIMSNPPTSIGGGEDEDEDGTTTPPLQQDDEQLPTSQPSPPYRHDRAKKPTKSILRRSSFQSLGAALNGNVTSNSSTGTDSTYETCSNGTAGTDGSLKRTGSSNTPTASMNSGMKRITSFSTLEIREYNVTIGDNPGGSHGPPISLDWDYSTEMKICIDKYEKIRPPRRTRSQMYMTGSIRMWTLMKDLGYSMREIKEAAKDAELVRKKRQKSLSKNPISKLGSKMGKIFRRKETAAA